MSAISNTNVVTNARFHRSLVEGFEKSFAAVNIIVPDEEPGIVVQALRISSPTDDASYAFEWPIKDVAVSDLSTSGVMSTGGPARILVADKGMTAENWLDGNWRSFEPKRDGPLPLAVAQDERRGVDVLSEALKTSGIKQGIVVPNAEASKSLATAGKSRDVGPDRPTPTRPTRVHISAPSVSSSPSRSEGRQRS